jgi:RHH-type proline utilization regulon transcriptional repressor/proline dehydrogenase/delta 1-pyrroline-5-carboxylate dehydrogenase
LKLLEEGESWAVQPKQVGDDGRLWSPGVKWDVQPGSFTHRTELFGPVLGVMRFTSLDEAIALVNATGYGLTSGLETLDDREQQVWKAGVRAGNLYINRPTTGAVVLRQPFGGMGKSCIGPGMKAGGPNYVAQFMTFDETDAIANLPQNTRQTPSTAMLDLPTDFPELPRLRAAIASYQRSWREEFGRTHDDFRLIGEDNLRRYLTFREVRVRVDHRDSHFEVFARVCAARVTGARVVVSTDHGETSPLVRLLEQVTQSWAAGIEFIEESDAELEASLRDEHDERIRFASSARVPAEFRRAAAKSNIYLADAPVLAEGRVELLWYLREQSVTHAYHRYGKLGARSAEVRAEPS